jgi:chemosensory pili system protein ChpA (sensor histidine kinase/response regulator)
MATEADIDIALNDVGPLVWILREVDASLDAARASIRKFLREQQESARDGTVADTSTLRSAKAQIHQAVGAVQVVGVPGAATFLRALEAALERCVQRPELLSSDNQAMLEKAMNALRDYMQSIIAGRKPQPVKLFVQYAAVQQLAEGERIHPADLWELEFEWRDVPLDAHQAAWSGPLGSQFEKALLQLLRGAGREAGAQLREPLAALGAASHSQQARGFWAMAAGVAEALASSRLKVDDHIKRAFTRINLQVKQFLGGNQDVSERNARDLLFFCAQAGDASRAEHPTLVLVRNVYALSRFEPIDYTQSHFGAIDPSVVKQAQKRVSGVKELWAELSNGDITRTKALLESIDLVTDSLAQVQPGTEDLGASLAGIVKASVKDSKFLTAERSLEVANALLFLEASFGHVDPGDQTFRERCANLRTRLDSVARGQSAGAMEPWMEQLYHQASESQTMGSVVQELKTSLGAIEASLDKYFRDPTDKASLSQVPAQLGQMRGVLSVLGLDQASAAVAHARGRTEDWLLSADRPPQEQFDQLAQNIGSLSFMIDLLAFQPTLTRSLFVFDATKGEFRAVMGRGEGSKTGAVTATSTVPAEPAHAPAVAETMHVAPSVAAVPAFGAATQAGFDSKPEAEAAGEQRDLGSQAAAQVAPSGAAAAASAWPVASAAVPPAPLVSPVTSEEDDELLGIFLDEARDVVAGGLEQVAHLRRFNADADSQITVRRAFHTLKGSSRMVGLIDFGEAAWQLEQVFNGWLAQQRPATEPLLDLAKDALEHFERWVDRISQRQPMPGWSTAFTRSAEAFKSGAGYLPIQIPAAAEAAPTPAIEVPAPTPSAFGEPTAATAVVSPSEPAAPVATATAAAFEEAAAAPLEAAEPLADLLVEAVVADPARPAGGDAPEVGIEVATVSSTVEALESTDDLLALFEPQNVDATATPPATVEPPPATPTLSGTEDLLDFSLDLSPPGEQAAKADVSIESAVEAMAPIDLPVVSESPAAESAVSFEIDPELLQFEQQPAASASESQAPAAADVAASQSHEGAASPLAASVSSEPSAETPIELPDFEALLDQDPTQGASSVEPSTSSAYQPTMLLSPEQAAALRAELHAPASAQPVISGPTEAPDQAFAVFTVSTDGTAGTIDLIGETNETLPPVVDVTSQDTDPTSSKPADVEVFGSGAVEGSSPVEPAEDVKVIGPLQVPLQLYTIFLSEADELVRQLNMRLDEWRHMPATSVPDEAVSAAHTLGGTAGIVGLTGLSELGYEMEAALLACRGNGHTPNEFQFGVLAAGADEMRRLLHHFAAGFYREAQPDIRAAVHDLRELWHANEGPGMTSAAIPAIASLDDAAGGTGVPALDGLPLGGEQPMQAAASPTEPTSTADSGFVGSMTTAFAASDLTLPPIDDQASLTVTAAGAGPSTGGPDAYADQPIPPAEPMAQGQSSAGEVGDVAQDDQGFGAADLRPPAPVTNPVAPSIEPLAASAVERVEAPVTTVAPSPSVTGAHEFGAPSILQAPAPSLVSPAPSASSAAVDGARAPSIRHETVADTDIDEVDVDLFPIFEEEALELIPQLAQALRDWQSRPAESQYPKQVLRTLHTLKGSARLAGAMRLGDMAHRLETDVEHVLREDASAERISELIESADEIAGRFEQLRRGEVHSAHEYEYHAAPAGTAEATGVVTVTATDSAGMQSPSPAGEIAAAVPLETPELLPPLSPPLVLPTVTAHPSAADAQQPPMKAALAPIARLGSSATAGGAQGTRGFGGTQAVRVRAQLLDRLFNQTGEVSITRARLETGVGTLRASLADLTDNLARLRQQLRDIELQAETQMQSRMAAHKDSAVDFDPLEFDRFTRFQELTRMMAESVNDVATVQQTIARTLQSTEDELQRQARMTRELQRDLLRTRMIEFESLSERLYRVVRQAAKDLGKNVRLDIEGGQIEIDRGVLDRMAGSFEHLLRNCVAHGIEPPEQRLASGKSEIGQITIGLRQEGNEVTLTFSDDGGGLHFDKIREKGIRQGLIQADQPVSEQELAELIFTPGFSTADSISEVAGRGIGMDVVKTEILGLGGRVTVQTQQGQGSTFTLVLPLTTAVTQIVLVRVGPMTVGIPASLVEIVQRVKPEELKRRYDSGIHAYAGTDVDFFPLGALLQVPIDNIGVERYNPIVVVRSAAQRVAVHVEEVLGNQEVVVRNLGPQLSRVPGLAGMSVLASGAVVLIYNPVALASVYGAEARRELAQSAPVLPSGPSGASGTEQATARGAPDGASAPQATVGSVTSIVDIGSMSQVMAAIQNVPKLRLHAEPTVMVVDDSLTVRRVTQRFLQRNGFRVIQAKDGLDALEVLQTEHPHVMLLDIEMPRMDGFDLTRNMRADPLLKQIPIIMITSRIADKHKMLALELGVSHYLGKPFNEEELLSLIGRYTTAASTAEAAGG